MADVIELQNRALTCAIVPEFGASVIRMDVVRKGTSYNVLSPTAPEVLVPGFDPRLVSLAHIAPVGGPIRHNKFRWDGKDKLLQPNLPGFPVFTNGVAWQRPWTGKKDGKHSATCRFEHKADATWPFSFSMIVIFDLDEDNLSVTYEIANEGKQGIMPVGFGATMRLPKNRNAEVSSGVSSLWQADAEGVPTHMVEVPFNLDLKEGLKLDLLDTPERWFSGWIGKLSVDYESKLSIMLKAESELAHLGFSCSKADDFIRLTPLTHTPGMLDLKGFDEEETGYRVLGPGESTGGKFKVDVDLSLY